MKNLKARAVEGSSLSSSGELESSELESVEMVDCPAFGCEIARKKCLEYQSIKESVAYSSPINSKVWKACRCGCPHSLIGPEGHPIELDEIEIEAVDEGFVERLKGLIKSNFHNKETLFARAADLSPSGLKRYLSGGEPSRPKLIAMAKAANVNLLWLATGEGPKQARLERGADHHVANDEYALIPLYDVTVSAGGGAFNDQENILMRVPFLRKWLRAKGLHEKDLGLVRVHGDSMEHTLNEDDLLLIDKSQRRPSNGHIYIVYVQGALIVKRLQMLPSGDVLVLSDNKLYPEERVSLEQLDIVGRAVWKGGIL